MLLAKVDITTKLWPKSTKIYFLAILPVHPEVKKRSEVAGHATETSLNDTETANLKILEDGPCSTSQILDKLGLESRTGAFRRNVKNLMDIGFIEYLYPENPKYPNQKYRLKQ